MRARFSISISEITFREQELNLLFAKNKCLENDPLYSSLSHTHTHTQHHVSTIDQEGYLGFNEDSIHCYLIGDQRRAIGNALLPSTTPYQAIADSNEIKILMKGD